MHFHLVHLAGAAETHRACLVWLFCPEVVYFSTAASRRSRGGKWPILAPPHILHRLEQNGLRLSMPPHTVRLIEL